MRVRVVAFVIFAVAVAAGCVRLGFWQLDRLRERRDLNAMLARRLGAAPAPWRDVLRDPATAAYRRAGVSGAYDFSSELALASRTRQGSPGVNIITPLRIAGSDTAVLVNRGWVYAPDAMTIDFARWLEPATGDVTGYVVEMNNAAGGPVSTATNPRVIRHLQYDSLVRRFPYPIAPFVLVASNTAAGVTDSVPVRVAEPFLDEGPHLGYAIQWFTFALIGLVGAAIGVRAERRGRHRAEWGGVAVPQARDVK